jgi:heme exporter protein A
MLSVQSLACRRGGRFAFRNISFALKPGDLLSVAGANGSGKSSLLRILAGLLPVAQGEMLWQDKAIAADWGTHRQRLHYVGHLDALKPELTTAEMLGYWRALHGISRLTFSDPYMILGIFGIEHLADKYVRHLSAGQKRRLTLTRLALSDVPLWLLDEPTTALDHVGREVLSALIMEHRDKGGIAIIATHHAMELPGTQQLNMGERSNNVHPPNGGDGKGDTL